MSENLSRRKFLMTGSLVVAATIAPLPSYAASPLKPDKIARKRLLLVDNDPNFQLFVRDSKESWDYEVITAGNGREALEVLEQDIPDLIISNVVMPKMGGYVFVQRIRQDKRTRSIPFMFLSDQRQTQDIVQGLNLGADEYMQKRCDQRLLMAQVEALLKQSHRLSSSKASSIRKRVLLVNYLPSLNGLIKKYLELRGYQVIPAFNGKEALEILGQDIPDLIVSDVMMPVMDGYTFVENIRQNKRTHSTPLLFLSTKSRTQDWIKGLNLGADRYMVKPFEPDELVAQIEALIRQSRRPNGSKTSSLRVVV